MAHSGKIMTFCQILPLVTSGDLSIDLSVKNDRNTFESTHSEQSSVFFSRLSIPLSFLVWWCGHFDPPSPPTRAKVAETATWALVNAFRALWYPYVTP